MTRTIQLTVACLVALVASAGQLQAGVLFGVQLGNINLVTIDSVTGAINNVGLLPNGSNPNDAVQGLTLMANGNLLYTDGDSLAGVHELNPANASVIASYGLPDVFFRGGLSFDTPSNTLFSVNNGDPVVSQSGLGGTVNLNFIPDLNPEFPGAIGGDDNGRHFAQGFQIGLGNNINVAIHEFNPLTGAFLNSLPTPSNEAPSGLAFDGQFLYASDLSSNQLFTLNPDTGSIVNQVTYDGQPLTALAASPVAPPAAAVPEPTSLAIFGIGALGLVASGIRRRRKQTA